MSVSSQQILEDLRRVLGDIDEILKSGAATPPGEKPERDPELERKLTAIRLRIEGVKEGLGRELHRRVEAADQYFRDNTWKTVGAAAALAFIAGVVLARPSRSGGD